MKMNRIVYRDNMNTIENLNDLLRRAKVKGRINIEEIDTPEEFGVMVSIPSIFNDESDPFELRIVENIKESSLSVLTMIDAINRDITELFETIKPSFIKLVRVKESFEYVPDPFYDLDNTRELNIKIKINENYIRYN